MARRDDVDPVHVLCGLTTPTDDLVAPRLVPPGTDAVDLVLAVADGTPRNPLTRRRDPLRATGTMLRRLIWHKFGMLFTALLLVVVAGFTLLLLKVAVARRLSLARELSA